MKRNSLIALVSLIGLTGFSQITCDQIKTVDGTTYRVVKVRRVEPDGISIAYAPASGGIGMTKLKFSVLPEEIRRQFGYDAEKAGAYEAEQLQSLATYASKAQLEYQEATNKLALRLAKERQEALEEEKNAKIEREARNQERRADEVVNGYRRRVEILERMERRIFPYDSPAAR